ncbi:MAG: transketolase C-terminal domain-containing protein, partial [Frisingicoccus sp.]|nr:transketolase C-terminal domain-containing protein [Frisingicoccus sp.]
RVIKTAKKEKRAVLVHVITQKGRGYKPAEVNPSEFHGVGKFDVESGQISKSPNMTYTEAFSKAMLYIGTKDERVVAVSAAMPSGTGLVKFSKRFPKRFFDVGIAEEHAVTFSGGLAAAGLKPYVAIYSSFFQRAYDQIIHDVCIPDLPVVFCIDRAGIVGADGETHQGILDLSFFSSIPGMTVFAPKNKFELYDIMKFSLDFEHPLAIRYPRGDAYEGEQHHRAPIVYGKSELLYQGEQVALVAVGSMVETAIEVKDQLAEAGIHATVVNARFVKPLDTDMLDDLCEKHNMIVTLEENVLRGGFGEAVSDYYMIKGSPVCVRHVGIPDVYVEHGNVALLKQSIGMDAWAISSKILSEVLI